MPSRDGRFEHRGHTPSRHTRTKFGRNGSVGVRCRDWVVEGAIKALKSLECDTHKVRSNSNQSKPAQPPPARHTSSWVEQARISTFSSSRNRRPGHDALIDRRQMIYSCNGEANVSVGCACDTGARNAAHTHLHPAHGDQPTIEAHAKAGTRCCAQVISCRVDAPTTRTSYVHRL